MKKTAINTIALIISAFLILFPTACGIKSRNWMRDGYYTDENGYYLSITYKDTEDDNCWFIAFSDGDDDITDSYFGFIKEKGDFLKGILTPEGDYEEITVTISEEGNDGLLFEIKGGEIYHFVPLGIPDADILITVTAEGLGSLAYSEGAEVPTFDPEQITQSAKFTIVEPMEYTFAAFPADGYSFEKWVKDGKDYSTQQTITVMFVENADYIAVFADSDGIAQNDVDYFAGEYQSENTHVTVDAEGESSAKITIEQSDSTYSLSRWNISGVFDAKTRTVAYTGCIKKHITYYESGKLENETIEYENGTGTVYFNMNFTLTWMDEQSDCDMIVFKKQPTESD